MAQPDPTSTWVLSLPAIRWGIDTLGAQAVHPTFAMFLYLRLQSKNGSLAQATAEDLKPLLALPGAPGKPHYLPLIDRGDHSNGLLPTFWRAGNLAGMWSPRSLFRQVPARFMSDNSGYVMPADYADQAFSKLLFNERISALALGAYLLRNYGFQIAGTPDPADIVAGFRDRFAFDNPKEFDQLFTTAVPGVTFPWFEPSTGAPTPITAWAAPGA